MSDKKKEKKMFDYILRAVDKVFYQVYDGEPVRRKQGSSTENILEEEVLFCKNNVIIKIISDDNDKEDKEIAGYMNIKKVYKSDVEYTDLMLSWVPNSFLSIESTEDAEILTPPKPSELINPNRQPSKYTLDSYNEQLQQVVDSNQPLGNTENDNKSDNSAIPSIQTPQSFDSPLGNVFSVNLIDMKTVKLFYTSIGDMDAGQFVIGSHNNEYKVFHFRNGGLNKIADIFDFWNGCSIDSDLIPEEVGQKVYYVNTKTTRHLDSGKDLPAEEGRYKALNMNNWLVFVNQLGQIEDSFNFRKHVFFGGLSHEVRPDAWKFLLYYYPMHSTQREREVLKDEKTKVYEAVHKKRLSLSGEEYQTFWRNVQFTVDKDVVRTDRSHPYYAGQDNPNIQKMRNILLNYAVYNPTMGYTQGMSDLVAPVLAILHDEVDSFWCFVGLMESSMFAATPTDDSMDKSLEFFRELLRLMAPDFYMHCLCNDYDLNLLFAHRWLVLCFKREFIFHEVLKIWEACWARYQTDYFQIFICVAMITLYGGTCLEKNMDAVEILQYFTEMATKFDGSATLKEARLILHKFRQLNRIPCSLRGLLSGKGVWDGGISPEVECVSHHKKCCIEFTKEEPTTGADNSGSIETVLEGSEGPRENEDTSSKIVADLEERIDADVKTNLSFNESENNQFDEYGEKDNNGEERCTIPDVQKNFNEIEMCAKKVCGGGDLPIPTIRQDDMNPKSLLNVAQEYVQKSQEQRDSLNSTKQDNVGAIQDSVETTQESLNTTHGGVETTQDGVETKQDGVETTQDGVETTQDGVETKEDGVETTQDGVETIQDGVEMAQDSVETTQNGVETTHDGIETTQDGVETAQDSVENSQEEATFRSSGKLHIHDVETEKLRAEDAGIVDENSERLPTPKDDTFQYAHVY